jgi:hypothetical protein
VAIRQFEGTEKEPGKKGYVTTVAETPEDCRKLRNSDLIRKTVEAGKENVAKQAEDQRLGEEVQYPNGKRLRLPTKQAEDAVAYMRRNVKGGPPRKRPTFQIGARIVDGKVVRD